MSRPLSSIVIEMEDLSSRAKTDPEKAHARADDLLLEAIEYLARGHGRKTIDMSADLRMFWRKCGKWYA